ncbi:lytic transglycosylase domain-containing protein [Zavarzinia compransoris]|uniref:lytic transglycosylase domain-containing protein n=1 Tax=Zavarzinia marina TaxID=2911065 RepID=UPI001F2BB099|nr:lytic transglycosylase domain-containing protein [Zavarzinia marina]MCF4165124.1 lytic transglycosylase domain-containing protein [Zavarzinia marina]
MSIERHRSTADAAVRARPVPGREAGFGRRAGRVVSALALGTAALLCFAPHAVAGNTAATAGVAQADGGRTLHALSREDLRHYRAAFAAQDQGDFAVADREIAQLTDFSLVGHLMRERYLDTERYRASKRELANWLAAYDDLPGRDEIEMLAALGNPTGAGDGRGLFVSPAAAATTSAFAVMAAPLDAMPLEPRGRPNAYRGSRSVSPRIAAALQANKPDKAISLLEEPRVGGRLDAVEREWARDEIARHLYRLGDDQAAYEMASGVADRSRAEIPMADWTAGLAAWRLGETAQAGIHFAALAESENVSAWVVSAAAFWAARADLVAGRPERVLEHLTIAADYPNTFYGLMATRLLGRDIAATPQLDQIDARSLNALAFDPAVQRAAGLAAVGEMDLASAELGMLRNSMSPTETSGIDALAVRLGLVDPVGRGGRYPVPPWRPSQGLRIDRALLFAFAKQESGFNTRARSPVGAIGLMQLMPSTARIVADRRGIDLGRKLEHLTDPGTNLSLGQAYIEMLMANEGVGSNLFLVAAAYNAGPGAAIAWQKTVKYNGDPLLFIESIPAGETRLFIERILANFWIYQARLGQTLETLDAAAAGSWPIYVPQDREAIRVSEKRNAR